MMFKLELCFISYIGTTNFVVLQVIFKDHLTEEKIGLLVEQVILIIHHRNFK